MKLRERSTGRTWVRPVLAMAVLGVAAASLLMAPVGAHTNLSKGHVKFAHNADKVDKHHANAISRVAYDRVDNNALIGPAAAGTVLTATITAPKKGFLEIVASSDIFGGPGVARCWITIGGVTLQSTHREMQLSAGNSEDDCSTNGLQPVASGAYTLRLVGDVPDGQRFDEAAMSVQFIPFNGVGTKAGSTAIVRPSAPSNNE